MAKNGSDGSRERTVPDERTKNGSCTLSAPRNFSNATMAPTIPDGVNGDVVSTSVSESKPGSSGAQLSCEQAESMTRLWKCRYMVSKPTPSHSQSRMRNPAASSRTASNEPLIEMLL